jgi:hypothetical protein
MLAIRATHVNSTCAPPFSHAHLILRTSISCSHCSHVSPFVLFHTPPLSTYFFIRLNLQIGLAAIISPCLSLMRISLLRIQALETKRPRVRVHLGFHEQSWLKRHLGWIQTSFSAFPMTLVPPQNSIGVNGMVKTNLHLEFVSVLSQSFGPLGYVSCLSPLEVMKTSLI